MGTHKWRMSLTFSQEKAVNDLLHALMKEKVDHQVEFDFDKKMITIVFSYPAEKYSSVMDRLSKCL